jgi:hypothetical protein
MSGSSKVAALPAVLRDAAISLVVAAEKYWAAIAE